MPPEKVTGAHDDRRELLKMLGHLAPGDVVTVTRINRITLYQRDIPGVIELFEIFSERLVVADLCDNHVFEN